MRWMVCPEKTSLRRYLWVVPVQTKLCLGSELDEGRGNEPVGVEASLQKVSMVDPLDFDYCIIMS